MALDSQPSNTLLRPDEPPPQTPVDDDASSNEASEEDTYYNTPTLVRFWAPPGSTNRGAAWSETTKVATTTEKEHHTVSIYQKVLGIDRAPRYEDDVEAHAGQKIVNQTTSSTITGPRPKFLEVMHNWTEQIQEDGQFVANISVIPRDAPESEAERVYVGWVHVSDTTPSLSKLKNVLTESVSTRVPLDVHDVASSLLQRVKLTREKKFALGRYMVPGPIRYDGKSYLYDDEDHSCLFLSFPYLAVTDSLFEIPKNSRKTDLHPVRSLMQSRYHLQSTKTRDLKQSITTLAFQDVADCIQLPKGEVVKTARSSRWQSRVYVPQLWALSVSGDIMVTNGPISELDLRGSVLTKESLKLDADNISPIVRFEVEDVTNKVEKFLYPTSRCTWYYGLLNKKRKILANLGQKKSRQHGRFGSGADYPNFHMYHTDITENEIQVTDDNWIDILRGQADKQDQRYEQLVITIRRHTDIPAINEPTPTKKQRRSSNVVGDRLKPPDHRRARSTSSAGSSIASRGTQSQLEDFKSFFAWPFSEEKSADLNQSSQDRVLRWLKRLAKIVIKSHELDLDTSFTKGPHHASRSSSPTRSPIKPSISGITQKNLRNEMFPSFKEPQNNSPAYDISYAPELKIGERFQCAARLLKLFIPSPRKADGSGQDPVLEHPLVLIYWGVFRRILEEIVAKNFTPGQLDLMLTYMDDITALAESLHKGVRKYIDLAESIGSDNSSWPNNESAVIQTPIPAALEHVIDMFFSIVRFTIKAPQLGDDKDFQTVVRPHYKLAMKALESAKDLLIAAADENASQKSLGPVVTPEAIILLLLERLSKGVYKDGTINMTDVFDRILEQLATKVEKHHNRYLLLEINQICEEIDIIMNVLEQQKRCLEDLKAYLDPQTFDKPSTKRRTRFEFERFAIDRIVASLEEQIDGFSELKERGVAVTDQNIKLVESFDDDNTRVITLFTVVTIIVLPFSAVTGFYGMNISGGTGTTYDHFWLVASIFTGISVLVAFLIIQYWPQSQRAITELWDRRTRKKTRES